MLLWLAVSSSGSFLALLSLPSVVASSAVDCAGIVPLSARSFVVALIYLAVSSRLISFFSDHGLLAVNVG